jgi:hypothetical protein
MSDVHVTIFIEFGESPAWAGNLPAAPVVGDHVWVRGDREREKRHYVVIRRDWVLYGGAAAIQVYVEPAM